MPDPDLRDILRLERLEVNLFRGTSPDPALNRIYGGQVIAQALLAAYETVDSRVCHSLHGYFMRPGDPKIPIIFDVDRSRDGGSFTTRRVIAIQNGQQIFNMAASFQAPEPGLQHQFPMPDVPGPETLPSGAERARATGDPWLERPVEVRFLDGDGGGVPGESHEPRQRAWFRVARPIGDDPRWHQVVMAYASDTALLGASMRPGGLHWSVKELQVASLDHAMWFHRPTDFNAWHLYDMDSPSASSARGFNRGVIYRQDGTLVASCAQEGLLRLRSAK